MATSLSQHIQIWPLKSLLYGHITLTTHRDPNRASDLPSLWLIHSHTHTQTVPVIFIFYSCLKHCESQQADTHTQPTTSVLYGYPNLCSLWLSEALYVTTHIHRQTQRSLFSMTKVLYVTTHTYTDRPSYLHSLWLSEAQSITTASTLHPP